MPVLLILPVLWCIGLTVLPGALGQIDDNSTYVDAEALAEQLNLAREGIIDPDARPDDRRRWIDALFSFNTPQAQVLVVELLEYGENPAAQQALCEGIARHVRSHPERLDSSFVDPLIELLGSNSQDVRSAASRALADFPGDEVIKKLGSLAGRSDVAIDKRLAAIDAMVSKVDRRTVVHELMLLLETGVPEVTERVVAALEPVSREPLGADVERWRLWWAKKAELDEEAWLADRLSLYRDRMQHLERELKRVRERATRRHDAITAKTAELLREVFRGLGTDQQQAKLAEWLEDPLTEIILVSLDLIKAKMADEGQRPEGKVLQALIRLLDSEEATVRLSVLEIVQNLKNEPSVAQAVLGRMANETEPEVQHLLIRALGKLDVPEAFPTLIIHIADPHSPPDCVREAAIALGRIASKGCESDQLEDAIGALKARYHVLPSQDDALRAALLTAMAGVGDPAFAPEFLDAIESDAPGVVRPAMQGLRAIGEKSKLPRLRTLTAHANPLVRVAAIQAVGDLGNQDADVESVLTRLNPTIEMNELAREAAWGALQRMLAGRPLEMRLAVGERLRETPDLAIRYLQELAEQMSTINGDGSAAEAVYDRLASALVAHGNYAEALPHLTRLYEGALPRGAPAAHALGLRWVEAALWEPEKADLVGVIRRLIADDATAATREGVVRAIEKHFDEPAALADPERLLALLSLLRSVGGDVLGDEWEETLKHLAEKVQAGVDSTMPASSP